jgi:hypothetical protein
MQTKMTLETKTAMVLNHLKTHKKITSWDAINLFRATRLSAIIFCLRERGHSISTEMINDGDTVYGVYHYAGQQAIK